MRAAKIYIETSVFNFVFADDSPEKRDDTITLFKEIENGKYIPFTSAYAVFELRRASETKRGAMLELVTKYNMTVLPGTDEVRQLAEKYVSEGVIPQKYLTDAMHIAVATVNDLDLIVSYNFKHIVKLKTVTMTEAVNLREGYRRIGIYSPTEVIDNEE